jgi:hypothetical protein
MPSALVMADLIITTDLVGVDIEGRHRSLPADG